MNETEKLSRLCGFFTEPHKDEIISWNWAQWQSFKELADAKAPGTFFPKPVLKEIENITMEDWKTWGEAAYQESCFMFKPHNDFEDLMVLMITIERMGFNCLMGAGTVTFVLGQTPYFTEKYTEVEDLRNALYQGCLFTYKSYIEMNHDANKLGIGQFENFEFGEK